mmetsp:Transcript_132620/g.424393  ORF Transcript_132620/g.424393 Transcript_132620/m.424393 type:complete len:543 (-) Transcript_132620:170-1798(-)
MRRVPSLRKVQSHAVVELDDKYGTTVQARLDHMGSGLYQVLLVAAIGGGSLAISLDSVAAMNTAFARAYSMEDWQRSLLPTLAAMGSMLGLFMAGPLSDWRGRKVVLVVALCMTACSHLLLATLPARFVDASVVLALRFALGLSTSIQLPVGMILAVESCPSSARAQIIFGIQMLNALGNVGEGFLVMNLMPHFGEAASDNWRLYCLFMGSTALAMVPLMSCLLESPSFLAVKGDAQTCVQVLDKIARLHGLPPLQDDVKIIDEVKEEPMRNLWDIAGVFRSMIVSHFGLVVMLAMADSSRAFFVLGSAYVWKDLYQLMPPQRVDATVLNVISTFAPVVGLIISQRMLRFGVRTIAFVCSLQAAGALMSLMDPQVRSHWRSLLACIVLTKMTYGPLHTCLALMKAESFPTEIRVCAFAVISMVAELSGVMGQVLVEGLKENQNASSWTAHRLNLFFLLLMCSVLLCGLLTYATPGQSGDGRKLREYLPGHELKLGAIRRVRSDGSITDFLEVQSDSDSDGEQASMPLRRPSTVPNLKRSGMD